MKPFGLLPLALLTLAAAGCLFPRAGSRAASSSQPTADAEDSVAVSCARAGTDGSASCPTSPAALATPQLQEAVHDLRRLRMVTVIKEVGHGRLALTLGAEAQGPNTPLAYHLEHLYKAYRAAYDLGDAAALELWRDGRVVGLYTDQGLLLR